jgi:protein-disulfide isomerase
MRLLPALLLATSIAGPLAGPVLAADPPALTPAQRADVVTILRDTLRTNPSILRDALAALQADDDRRQDTAQTDVLQLLAGKLVDPADPVAGNPAAAVTLVEFYDTRCPYCRRLMGVTDELLRTDPGVRIVFKDLPILGPASQLESRALLAAQRQGGYLRLQAAVMRTSAPSTRDSLQAEAERQGLDGAALLRDMDDPAIKARLDANIALAQQIGLQGTPAMVIGTRLIPGAVALDDLRAAVAQARTGR